MPPRPVTDADIDSIVGAFFAPDRDMFRTLLEATRGLGGDLAELGVLYGASAALVGAARQEGEVFTVVDLFGKESSDDSNAAENESSYAGLTRAAFEANMMRVVGELPTIIEDYSSTIVEHAHLGSHRFVHVDASHLYDHVVGDVRAARALLKPDGIVVFDDFRAEHTPGVAAAVWQAVLTEGLRPVAVSPHKFYGTWGEVGTYQEALRTWVEWEPLWTAEWQSVSGHQLLRIHAVPSWQVPRHPWKRFVPVALWPAAAKVRRLIRRRH